MAKGKKGRRKAPDYLNLPFDEIVQQRGQSITRKWNSGRLIYDRDKLSTELFDSAARLRLSVPRRGKPNHKQALAWPSINLCQSAPSLPPLDAEAEAELIHRAQSGDSQAANTLVLHHVVYVRAAAYKHWRKLHRKVRSERAVQYCDFVAAGLEAIAKAIDAWKPGLRLNTYIRTALKGTLSDVTHSWANKCGVGGLDSNLHREIRAHPKSSSDQIAELFATKYKVTRIPGQPNNQTAAEYVTDERKRASAAAWCSGPRPDKVIGFWDDRLATFAERQSAAFLKWKGRQRYIAERIAERKPTIDASNEEVVHTVDPSEPPAPFESKVTTYYRGTHLAAAKLIPVVDAERVRHAAPMVDVTIPRATLSHGLKGRSLQMPGSQEPATDASYLNNCGLSRHFRSGPHKGLNLQPQTIEERADEQQQWRDRMAIDKQRRKGEAS
jgi:hypothetical protein